MKGQQDSTIVNWMKKDMLSSERNFSATATFVNDVSDLSAAYFYNIRINGHDYSFDGNNTFSNLTAAQNSIKSQIAGFGYTVTSVRITIINTKNYKLEILGTTAIFQTVDALDSSNIELSSTATFS